MGVHHQRTPKTTTPFLLQLVILLGAEPDAGNDEGDEDEEDPYGHPNDDHHPVIFINCCSSTFVFVVTCVDHSD